MAVNQSKPELAARSLILVLTLLVSSCHKSDLPQKPAVRVFAAPEQAGEAIQTSAKSDDQAALSAIFGPDSKELLFSGDPVQDKVAAQTFVAKYSEMHRWRRMKDGSQTLLVGADNFPFPIPLRKNAGGQWYFDAAAGKNEILNRRIGRNELAVIEICRALVDAQAEYFSQKHEGGTAQQYAMKFISDPGKQNGLYWKSAQGQPESPLGPQVTLATSEGYTVSPAAHAPFHGYFFRMLTGQGDKAKGGAKDYVADGKMVGGFAFVAYPAQYGESGVMTFMTNQDGVVFQKDLGNTTADLATAMNKFDPDTGWNPVTEPPPPR
jgi:hypothetical protein